MLFCSWYKCLCWNLCLYKASTSHHSISEHCAFVFVFLLHSEFLLMEYFGSGIPRKLQVIDLNKCPLCQLKEQSSAKRKWVTWLTGCRRALRGAAGIILLELLPFLCEGEVKFGNYATQEHASSSFSCRKKRTVGELFLTIDSTQSLTVWWRWGVGLTAGTDQELMWIHLREEHLLKLSKIYICVHFQRVPVTDWTPKNNNCGRQCYTFTFFLCSNNSFIPRESSDCIQDFCFL